MGHDRHHVQSVEKWLVAEHVDDDAAADRALQELLGALPTPAPPTSFAGRVMAAAAREGIVRAPMRRSWSGQTARVLGWCGVGTAALVATLVFLAPLLVRQVARLLNFSVQGFVWIVRGLEGGLDIWSLMAEIGRAVAASLTTPQVSGGAVVVELVGVAALYTLHRVLSFDKEGTQ